MKLENEMLGMPIRLATPISLSLSRWPWPRRLFSRDRERNSDGARDGKYGAGGRAEPVGRAGDGGADESDSGRAPLLEPCGLRCGPPLAPRSLTHARSLSLFLIHTLTLSVPSPSAPSPSAPSPSISTLKHTRARTHASRLCRGDRSSLQSGRRRLGPICASSWRPSATPSSPWCCASRPLLPTRPALG